ncbi:alginate export family protein [Limisphaera sp. 4302-co]|uniref:alginate export family protein n=1 Tax=Limisphaera sp. 4302-co TaxID=3400417 RepID=UPI003C2D5B5E
MGLLLPLTVFGQGSAAKSTTLLNQWLREQSPAWNAWDLGGEFRTRVETFHNSSPASANRHFQKSGVDNDDTYILTREKLHVGYRHSWLQVYAQLRNSNSSGEDRAGRPEEDRLDLQQAYVSLGDLRSFPVQLQVGRMEFVYADERLIGRSDWGNVPRSFDTVRLRFQHNPLWADTFVSRVVVPADGKFNQSNEKDHFWGLYGGVYKLFPWQDLELYFLGRNTDAPNRGNIGSRDIYTVGFRATSPRNSLGNWDYAVEALHQFGNVTQGGRQLQQDAWATSIAAGYTWKHFWGRPRLGFEYNFSTGDSDPNDDKSQTLDNLFPTNHKLYGILDVVGWRNIHNLMARLRLHPAATLTVSLDYHLFWLADTADFFYPQSGAGRNGLGYGRNPSYDNYLGSELDLEVVWSANKWLNLRAGYSHFFAGDYIDQSKQSVGGAADADWAYVQVTAVF